MGLSDGFNSTACVLQLKQESITLSLDNRHCSKFHAALHVIKYINHIETNYKQPITYTAKNLYGNAVKLPIKSDTLQKGDNNKKVRENIYKK